MRIIIIIIHELEIQSILTKAHCSIDNWLLNSIWILIGHDLFDFFFPLEYQVNRNIFLQFRDFDHLEGSLKISKIKKKRYKIPFSFVRFLFLFFFQQILGFN